MMSDFQVDERVGSPSGWVTGGVVFAAVMMIMIGLFQAFQGLVAIIDDEFYVDVADYTLTADLTAWGWIHLVLGALVFIAGFALFNGSTAAGVAAITLAGFSAVANFLFIPYYPVWSLVVIALAVYVMWAVTRSGILSSA
jgi:hypothetical protein